MKAVVKCDKCTSPSFKQAVTKDEAVGKTLAYTSIQFTNAKGEIAARGSHTKYYKPYTCGSSDIWSLTGT